MTDKLKAPIPPFDFDEFSSRLRAETDRACAVLGGAMLDARLKSLYERRLSNHWQKLLESMGPLSSFSARIKVAHALDWVDDDAFHDLEIIRAIRNEFAHSFDHGFSFSDVSVSHRCENLRSVQAFIEGVSLGMACTSDGISFAKSTIQAMLDTMRAPRSRFEIAVEFLSQHIDGIEKITRSAKDGGLLGELRAVGALRL